MRIFVVGAEGAGKTVFLAMLSRYLNTHHGGLVLDPADYSTSEYIVGVQHILEQGDWPPSTPMGQESVLKWKFGLVGKESHDLLMYDSAGQDLRTLMLAEDLEDLSEQDRASISASKASPGTHMSMLREQVHSADALVYLFDLESLLKTSDARVLNEHCWLLKTFLVHPRWRSKKRIVLLSKSDRFGDLLAASGNDVRRCIREHLPAFYSVGHYLDQPNVAFAAISSVATETTIDDDGKPIRRPCRPFRPGDMAAAASYLAEIAVSPVSKPPKQPVKPPPMTPKSGAKPPMAKGCAVPVVALASLLAMLAYLGSDPPGAPSLPIVTEFRDSYIPGGGKVFALRNSGAKPLIQYVLRIDSTDGHSFGPYRIGDLQPGEKAELGWRELNNWVLKKGERVTVSASGYREAKLVVP